MDLFGNSIAEPDPPPPDDGNGDAVILVRGGVPVGDIAALFGPQIVERMRADGTLNGDLKPVRPISHACWSEELEAYELALVRIFS